VPAELNFAGTVAAIVASFVAVIPVDVDVLVELLESSLPQAEMARAAAMTPATANEVRVVVVPIKNLPQVKWSFAVGRKLPVFALLRRN
jgi:hypothetical protein